MYLYPYVDIFISFTNKYDSKITFHVCHKILEFNTAALTDFLDVPSYY